MIRRSSQGTDFTRVHPRDDPDNPSNPNDQDQDRIGPFVEDRVDAMYL